MIEFVGLVIGVMIAIYLWKKYQSFKNLSTTTDCRNYGFILLLVALLTGTGIVALEGVILLCLYFFNRGKYA